VNQSESKAQSSQTKLQQTTRFVHTHYGILGLHPSASPLAIRRAYRELSKRYHPDTTELPPQQAKNKFQQLNEAYATLSNPERRSLYDCQIGYSRWHVIQRPTNFRHLHNSKPDDGTNSAYLAPDDRPLSAGEIFALLLMGLTLLACLLLAIALAWLRADAL
jgi:curved DNA-binding protein CbpA